MDIAPYPAAALLGGNSVVGFGGAGEEVRIHWQAWSTDAPPEVVIAHSVERLGPATQTAGDAEALWRFESGPRRQVLHVLAIEAAGPHHEFRDRWPAGARTAIVVSDCVTRPPGGRTEPE